MGAVHDTGRWNLILPSDKTVHNDLLSRLGYANFARWVDGMRGLVQYLIPLLKCPVEFGSQRNKLL